mgnify:CR=1 FL=1
MSKNFYCRKHSGDPDFSIEDWNKALDYCEEHNINGIERDKILSPELFPCDTQCFDCIADVGERRKKTKSFISRCNGD